MASLASGPFLHLLERCCKEGVLFSVSLVQDKRCTRVPQPMHVLFTFFFFFGLVYIPGQRTGRTRKEKEKFIRCLFNMHGTLG